VLAVQAAKAAQVDGLNSQIRTLQAQVEQQKAELAKASANSNLEAQLKTINDENARLRQALLQNSANANLWKEQVGKAEADAHAAADKLRKVKEIQAQFAAIAI